MYTIIQNYVHEVEWGQEKQLPANLRPAVPTGTIFKALARPDSNRNAPNAKSTLCGGQEAPPAEKVRHAQVRRY